MGGSPAADSGIKAGDVISKLDDFSLSNAHEVLFFCAISIFSLFLNCAVKSDFHLFGLVSCESDTIG